MHQSSLILKHGDLQPCLIATLALFFLHDASFILFILLHFTICSMRYWLKFCFFFLYAFFNVSCIALALVLLYFITTQYLFFLNKAKTRMNNCAIVVTVAESQTRGHSGMTVELLVSCILFIGNSGKASKNLRKILTRHLSMAI